jgi:hypothetical protein
MKYVGIALVSGLFFPVVLSAGLAFGIAALSNSIASAVGFAPPANRIRA